jgi:hypothetical protein
MENFNKDSILSIAMRTLVQGKLSASEAELELRKEVAKEEKLAQPTSTKTELVQGVKINLMLLITILQQSNELCL